MKNGSRSDINTHTIIHFIVFGILLCGHVARRSFSIIYNPSIRKHLTRAEFEEFFIRATMMPHNMVDEKCINCYFYRTARSTALRLAVMLNRTVR